MGAMVTAARAAVAILLCVGLGIGRPSAAQERGVLSGVVPDASGPAVPGATVTVARPGAPGIVVVTDEKGALRVPAIEPGSYTIGPASSPRPSAPRD